MAQPGIEEYIFTRQLAVMATLEVPALSGNITILVKNYHFWSFLWISSIDGSFILSRKSIFHQFYVVYDKPEVLNV